MAKKKIKSGKQLVIPVQKKKGAKPTIKLKDGKYTHKFLCRLDKAEGDKLQEIMNDENIKSFNGAVTQAVMDHKEMKDEISRLRKNVREIEQNNALITDTVNDYQDALKKLNNIKIEKRTLVDRYSNDDPEDDPEFED